MLKDAFYQKIKYTILLLLIMTVVLLSGCSNDDENISASENASTNIDEIISTEYYNFIMYSGTKFVEMTKVASNDATDYEGIKSSALEFNTYIKSNNVKPITKEDYVVDDDFQSFLISSEMSAESYIKYANTKESAHAQIARDYRDIAKSDLQKVVDILKSYGYK